MTGPRVVVSIRVLAVVRLVEVSVRPLDSDDPALERRVGLDREVQEWLSFENHGPVGSNRFVADAMSTVATAAITSNARLIYPLWVEIPARQSSAR